MGAPGAVAAPVRPAVGVGVPWAGAEALSCGRRDPGGRGGRVELGGIPVGSRVRPRVNGPTSDGGFGWIVPAPDPSRNGTPSGIGHPPLVYIENPVRPLARVRIRALVPPLTCAVAPSRRSAGPLIPRSQSLAVAWVTRWRVLPRYPPAPAWDSGWIVPRLSPGSGVLRLGSGSGRWGRAVCCVPTAPGRLRV